MVLKKINETLNSRHSLYYLAVFIIGLIATIIALKFSQVQQLFSNIEASGLIGAFLAGILYATAFTASSATVILAHISGGVNPVAVALIAAFGSMLYDLTVFTLVRNHTRHSFWIEIRKRFSQRPKLPAWLSTFFGFLILGSPLPDELAAGFLEFSNFTARKFIIISFLANFAGILIIALIGS